MEESLLLITDKENCTTIDFKLAMATPLQQYI
jgi:hypothetical protein